MRAVLASMISSCLVLQALGSDDRFNYQFGTCDSVRSGTNLPKVHDVSPLNVPCYSKELCSGSSTCCVSVGTENCTGDIEGRWGVSSNRAYYEGGCSPGSLDVSHEDYDPTCTQIGECHVGYMYMETRAVSAAGAMTQLPSATLDRLMAGSNWCSHSQSCQDTQCSPAADFSSCAGVQSGLNLEKVHDRKAPLNEVCHSSRGRHCGEGSVWCCVTTGTCVAADGERGVFVGSNKAYYEGGCSPESLDDSHEDYDPECTQQGECHHPFILQTRNGVALPGAMTPTPSDVLARLMKGSNWNPATQTCDDNIEPLSSYSSPRRAALGLMSLMVTFWR